MKELDIKDKLARREAIRFSGLSQREIARYLNKFPQQVHDATNGLQPTLWLEITKILGNQKIINKIKRERK